MSWATEGGEIAKLDYQEELDFLEIRLQKLESKDHAVRRKSAEALAPYVLENRYLDEVYARFSIAPPHPAQVIADGIIGPQAEKNSCMSGCQALAHMGPAAAPFASYALGVLMSNVDEELRWESARALGSLGPGAAEKASALMATQLDPEKESNVLVRFTVARSLGLLGSGAAEGAAGALAKALEDKDIDVQNASATALALIGPAAAQKAAKRLVKAMLEGTFEMRRLAVKALIAMGESSAGAAAYPASRVLNNMRPCCRFHYHAMELNRKPQPQVCDKCKSVGPFAKGTDYSCREGCNWHICRDCYCNTFHKDVVMQRLAAEAMYAMGAKAVRTCQVYLSRALGDPDEIVRETCQKALKMAGCDAAVQGSMALYDPSSCPCGMPECLFCKQKVPGELEDLKFERFVSQESGDDDESGLGSDNDSKPPSRKNTDPVPEAAVPDPEALDQHEDYVGTPPLEEPATEEAAEPACPDCSAALVWDDFDKDDYSTDGWVCNNESDCGCNAYTAGKFRWFCKDCLNDFCADCCLNDFCANCEPKAEPALEAPMTKPQEMQRQESYGSESSMQRQRDPWGPADQVRTRSKRPDLQVDTGPGGQAAQALAAPPPLDDDEERRVSFS